MFNIYRDVNFMRDEDENENDNTFCLFSHYFIFNMWRSKHFFVLSLPFFLDPCWCFIQSLDIISMSIYCKSQRETHMANAQRAQKHCKYNLNDKLSRIRCKSNRSNGFVWFVLDLSKIFKMKLLIGNNIECMQSLDKLTVQRDDQIESNEFVDLMEHAIQVIWMEFGIWGIFNLQCSYNPLSAFQEWASFCFWISLR